MLARCGHIADQRRARAADSDRQRRQRRFFAGEFSVGHGYRDQAVGGSQMGVVEQVLGARDWRKRQACLLATLHQFRRRHLREGCLELGDELFASSHPAGVLLEIGVFA